MRLGFSILTLDPGRVGGSESVVAGLLGQFSKGNGPERVSVIANEQAAETYQALASSQLEMVTVPAFRLGRGRRARFGAIIKALATDSVTQFVPVDLDLVHYPLTVPVPPSDLPVVVSLHDVQHHDYPAFFSRAERLFRAWTYDRPAQRAQAVVTLSAHARDRIVELLSIDESRVYVVPLGIDHARFSPHGQRDEFLLERFTLPRRFVIYPANLWPHKNHDRLLQALARTDPELSLVLTGQLLGRGAWLEQVATKLSVTDRLCHLGHVPEDVLPALYRRAEAMIFPSLYEGFGSPPLEAMACGCAVAASNVGALAEVCDAAALLFDPSDPDAIADALGRVTTDTNLRDSLRRAGLAHSARFTWPDTARRQVEVYKAVLG